MKIVYLFLVIPMLYGCSIDRHSDKYESVVAEWQGKFIELQSIMTDVLTGDTISLYDAEYIILTYVDSAGCSACNMKPQLWNEFFRSLNNISDAEILPLMIVCKSDKNEVSDLLKRYAYHYPVYLDKNDETNRKNSFPADPMLQTYLLDKDHKVVAIGNPTYSDGVADLYKSIISGKQVFSSDLKSMVKMETNKINIGKIGRGDVISKDIKIFNSGNDTVFVRAISTSCDCTEANISGEYITPHGESIIVVNLKGDSAIGHFERTVNIYYEGFDYPSTIKLHGIVENH